MTKKRKIRKLRTTSTTTAKGDPTSHQMAWIGDSARRRGDFGVFPTITPKKGKESSTDPKDWKSQTPKEAAAKGELIKVRRREKAKKLAQGTWKKGEAGKKAKATYVAKKKLDKETLKRSKK